MGCNQSSLNDSLAPSEARDTEDGEGTSQLKRGRLTFKAHRGKKVGLNEPSLYKHSEPLTLEGLEQLRSEFWHTNKDGAYGGKPEIWAALFSACVALLDGDMETANTYVKAAGVAIPESNLLLCYDKLGNEYKIPEYCFSRPLELVESSPAEKTKSFRDDSAISSDLGSTVVDTVLRVRLSPLGNDFEIYLNKKDDTVLSVKRQVANKLRMITVAQPSDSSNEDNGGDASSKKAAALMDVPASRQRIFFHGKELVDKNLISSLPEQCLMDIPATTLSDTNNTTTSPKKRKKSHPLQIFLLPKKQKK